MRIAGGGSPAAAGKSRTLTIGTTVIDDAIQPMNEQYTTFQYNAFDALVRTSRNQDDATPRLATSWERTSDTVWRFELREGVTFHDGSPLTAEDIVFTFEETAAKQYANAQTISTIKKVRAVGTSAVEIETSAPDPLLLARVGQVFIVPKAYWKEVGEAGFNAAPIGSGQFRITKFKQDEGIDFTAYKDYWGEAPKTSEIKLRYFTDAGALTAALEAGQVDAAQELRADALPTLKNRSGITVATEFSGNQNMLQLNTSKGPFKDIRVRQAANKAIDAQALVKAITYGGGVLEDGQLPIEGVFGHSKDIKRPAYDPEGARKLLKEAGAVGAKIEITGMNLYKNLYESVAAQLDAVGFSTTVRSVETGVWVQEFRSGSNADIFYRGVSYTGVFDADRAFSFVSSSAKPFVDDPEWDRLYTAQRSELDPVERQKLLEEASKYLNEQSYLLWTYGRPTVGAMRDGVSGLTFENGLMLLIDKVSKK